MLFSPMNSFPLVRLSKPARRESVVVGLRIASSLALGLTAGIVAGCSSTPEAAAVSGADAGNEAGRAIDAGRAESGLLDGETQIVATRPASVPVAPLFIGSGGLGYGVGSAFPGAAAPQGMAKVGPETSGTWGTIDFMHCSGYWFGDDVILGFSHMHLHGTGDQDYGILGIMPVDGFDATKTTQKGYSSHFEKSSESAVPGRYAVTLTNGGIEVAITATAHAAHHRYVYPSSATTGHVVFDLDHHLSGTVTSESVTLDPSSRTLTGSFRSIGQMSSSFGGSMIYFAAQTRQNWSSSLVWSGGGAPAPGTTAAGTGVGVDLDFDLAGGNPIEVQVGLSLTSIAAAQANLAAEMPSFAFDAEAKATGAAWSHATSAVSFTGGTSRQKTMLDAALYHLFLMPTIMSDVSGDYVGLDGKVANASDYAYCSDMSLWDTYRTLNPLYDLIAPKQARDVARSLTAMGKAAGYFPKWPIATGESGTMIGASAEVVLAHSYVNGITDFDAEGAYQILKTAAMSSVSPAAGRGGRTNAPAYMELGYVPASVGASASWTIEYGQDDVALGQLAAALGHSDDAATLAKRAQGIGKLFDPKTGFLWAKNADGSWATGHQDPTAQTTDFDEANAWQSVWGPFYAATTLSGLFGGNAELVAKLESFFELGQADYNAIMWQNVLSGGAPRKYYWGGNEPDMASPYLFALAGRPDLTQKWVRWIEEEVYGDGADGLPGNDDGGTMSAWLVWSALGIYPLPGTDQYVLGAPMFPHATIRLATGTFAVEASSVSGANAFVQSVMLNGKSLTTPLIHGQDLRSGGSLVFSMGPSPSAWGSGRSP
jgi:predicted alpha-1,2-mannosidase